MLFIIESRRSVSIQFRILAPKFPTKRRGAELPPGRRAKAPDQVFMPMRPGVVRAVRGKARGAGTPAKDNSKPSPDPSKAEGRPRLLDPPSAFSRETPYAFTLAYGSTRCACRRELRRWHALHAW